jgi:hypothetical protein
MNDQLKKYIEDNREGFDHLEPADDIFLRVRAELKTAPQPKKGLMQLWINHKWMAAASILIVMSITYLLVTNTAKQQQGDNLKLTDKKQLKVAQPTTIAETGIKANEIEKNPITVSGTRVATAQPNKKRQQYKHAEQHFNMSAIYRKLTDSSSASTRLAAVLQLQKSQLVNNDMIDRLAKTLNQDPNSNVRLAVIGLMGSYAQDSYVSSTCVRSLSNQKDPLVQLELINLLSRTNDTKLDEKLFALANDPNTFAMVKDQAYLVLLNQNKL